MNDTPNLTLRDIHKRTPGYAFHQLKYIVENYGPEPRARVGIIRLWAEADVPFILSTLRRTCNRRGVTRV